MQYTKFGAFLLLAAMMPGIPGYAGAQDPKAPATAAPSESYVDRMQREGATLALSLQEALERALQNNLDIAIEAFSQDFARERIRSARGFYDPVLSMGASVNSTQSPLIESITAGRVDFRDADASAFGPALSSNIPGGGSFTLSWQNSRSVNNRPAFFNPLFVSSFDVTYSQPLLKGFLQTGTERQLKILTLDSRYTYSQFRLKVTQIVQQVLNQYWELVFAIENYEVLRRSRDLALAQYESTRLRVQNELLAPVALTSSSAEVASREQGMIQSEVAIIVAQNSLKRLLSSSPEAQLWQVFLIPTDWPKTPPVDFSLEEAIREARKRRPELEQYQILLEQNQVDLRYYASERKPSLNLAANLGSAGRSGYAASPLISPENPAIGGYPTAWGQLASYDFPSWGVGLSFRVPIPNRTAESNLAQTRLYRERTLKQMTSAEQGIIVEVRNAWQVIGTQKKSLESARSARKLSDELLAGETARFEAGFSTNFEVLRYQRDAEAARVRELRALVDYQQAVIALQRAMDLLLESSRVTLPPPRNP